VKEPFSVKHAEIFEKRQAICLQRKIEALWDLGILGPSQKVTGNVAEQLQVSGKIGAVEAILC
jgi:hypothetical protein